MTRKDYQLIANAIRDALTFNNEPPRVKVERLADALAADNPRFDRERFLKACGIE